MGCQSSPLAASFESPHTPLTFWAQENGKHSGKTFSSVPVARSCTDLLVPAA